ncbi:melanoma-associated antigen B16-like [Cavia porcellus]|uniref:melanoma-associated antigen B16-like n=1 Tax=Cavia porcellus TaxID=10141 RepID=UPI000350ABCF|nr:melanoma-associated antigen B16-like [Cavia porcellus]
MKEAPLAETPSSSKDIQHSFFSSSNSVQGASSQENDQICTKQSAVVPGNAPHNALEEKAALLVGFMLLEYQMKQPITKENMLEVIMQKDEAHFTKILLQACQSMEMVFGLHVKGLDPINHCYVIFIELGLTYDAMQSDEGHMPKTGFLICLLVFIFIKGNHVSEEKIWKALNLTGRYPGKDHFLFEDLREIITKESVKEKFVDYQPVANSDPLSYEFL